METTPRQGGWDGLGDELFSRLQRRLNDAGYRETNTRAPGTYTVARDGGPGWASWMFWLDVYEAPERPVLDDLGAIVAAYRRETAR